MRGVNCYDKNGITSFGCSRIKRPTTVQSCPILSCQQSTMSGVHLSIDQAIKFNNKLYFICSITNLVTQVRHHYQTYLKHSYVTVTEISNDKRR